MYLCCSTAEKVFNLLIFSSPQPWRGAEILVMLSIWIISQWELAQFFSCVRVAPNKSWGNCTIAQLLTIIVNNDHKSRNLRISGGLIIRHRLLSINSRAFIHIGNSNWIKCRFIKHWFLNLSLNIILICWQKSACVNVWKFFKVKRSKLYFMGAQRCAQKYLVGLST